MARVFISYRREDSAASAGRIQDRLERELGRDHLFIDVDGIPLGVNFAKVLHEEVGQCGVLLAVIGPNWLDVRDEDGTRRLDNPTDFVRIEIAAALEREIPVIPILLDGSRVPKTDQLPEELKELALRNGLNVRHASFHADLDKLVRDLKDQLEVPRQTAPAGPPPEAQTAETSNLSAADVVAPANNTIATWLLAEPKASVLLEALTIARCVDNPLSRADMLSAIAECLPAEMQFGVLSEALTAARALGASIEPEHLNTFAHYRATRLGWIATLLPAEARPAVFDEALTTARSIDDPPYREYTLGYIAKLLSAEQGLVVARSMDDPSDRAETLTEIAARLPAAMRPSVLDEALTAARAIDDVNYRVKRLTETAAQLPAEMRTGVLNEALTAARGIDDLSDRAKGLTETATQLPAESRSSVLDEALTTARSIDDSYSRDSRLWEITKLLPAEQGLVVARGIDSPSFRAQTLTEIATRLPIETWPTILSEALNALRNLKYLSQYVEALTKIAAQLPADARPSVLNQALTEALTEARSVDQTFDRAEALADIAAQLPVEARPAVYDEALTAARSDERGQWYLDSCLADAARHLPAEQGLVVARRIDNPEKRAKALTEIATRLLRTKR